ncbi:MAG: archaellin/type IV pilin N-terminal domain-containing protein [Candidatus Thorarchaeota archaeon]
MIVKKIKRLYARRKAISPIVAALLLIALTVAAVAIVFFVILPLFKTYKMEATIVKIYDTNKDSLYNRIELQLANIGTQTLNISEVIIWICVEEDLGNSSRWVQHTGWTFDNPNDAILLPSEIVNVYISGTMQIGLTIYEYTWYRLEINHNSQINHYFTSWARLNDQVDLSDLLTTFDTFNLTAYGFEGTVDDIHNDENNYLTDDSGDFQLENQSFNYLPVLDEGEFIPFWVTNSVVIFPSENADFEREPQQKIDFSSTPFRARKFFMLGLAGSWGDDFALGAWALNLTFVYTDNSQEEFLLGHEYIDDWYYNSNNPKECVCAPYGKITEINLGEQIEQNGTKTGATIHTHTTRFYFDFYKYIKYIIFTDPNNDDSGPHLISLTFA